MAEETGFPEIMDGRVKTLRPRSRRPLALRDNAARPRADHGIAGIDAGGRYPFEATVAGGGDYDGLRRTSISTARR